MKIRKLLLLAIIITALGSCCKQHYGNILKVRTLQPGPNLGVNATVQGNLRYQNENFGSLTTLDSWTWTDDRNGSPSYDARILINFPQLNEMAGHEIDSVKLTLYRVENFPYANGGQFGPNANFVYCITKGWDQNTVTWNNQPPFDSIHSIFIPRNNNYDSIAVDLTALVPEEMKTGNGFIFIQQNNTLYSSSVFCSSNDSIASKRPKLTIYYK